MTKEGSKSPKPTHHYGRGGAGNVIAKTNDPAAGQVIETTPVLKSKMYTTGRGGTGNMAKNDDAEEARAAQDIDIPGITLPEGPAHYGRGGAGNLNIPNDQERLEAKEHNERIRRESFKNTSRDRSGIKALAEKAKEAVKGKSDDS